jgi:hypothetical protein
MHQDVSNGREITRQSIMVNGSGSEKNKTDLETAIGRLHRLYTSISTTTKTVFLRQRLDYPSAVLASTWNASAK